VRGRVALELAVELERAGERVRLAALAEPSAAVPQQEPCPLDVGRDDLRHAIRPPRGERDRQGHLEGLHRRALLQVQVILRRRDPQHPRPRPVVHHLHRRRPLDPEPAEPVVDGGGRDA